MGDHFTILADIDATASEAPGLAARVTEWLVSAEIIVPDLADCVLGADLGHPAGPRYTDAIANPAASRYLPEGVQICVGRTVFHAFSIDRTSCPHCAAAASDDDMSEAIRVWFDTGFGDHRCATCGQAAELNDWRWEPPWAFGYFGLKMVAVTGKV